MSFALWPAPIVEVAICEGSKRKLFQVKYDRTRRHLRGASARVSRCDVRRLPEAVSWQDAVKMLLATPLPR
jgi:hypothetical protein